MAAHYPLRHSGSDGHHVPGSRSLRRVLKSDQDNKVLINLGADADTVTFLGEDVTSDELVVNDEDGSLILTADYLDGVGRVGVHSDDGSDIKTLTGTGSEVGSLTDDGVDCTGSRATGPFRRFLPGGAAWGGNKRFGQCPRDSPNDFLQMALFP